MEHRAELQFCGVFRNEERIREPLPFGENAAFFQLIVREATTTIANLVRLWQFPVIRNSLETLRGLLLTSTITG